MLTIHMIQLALKRAGFYNGALDGIFGSQTETAVRNFQKRYGIAQTGEINGETQQLLIPYLKGYFVHEIRSGDTFYKLSKEYGTDIMNIVRANPLVDPYNLQIGSDIYIPLDFPFVTDSIPYTSQLNNFICDGLLIRYPFLKGGSIGRSVMGREIRYLRIGRGATEVFYNASHHANEWITTPVLLKFIEQYARAYAVGDKIFDTYASELYHKSTLYVVPMVNPDGVDLVNGAINDTTYYAKAKEYAESYPDIPFPSGWKANINGVDLNLQYPANWDKAKEIKFSQGFTKPGPRDYVGTAPLTQSESRAVYDFTLARNFEITLSYHTQGKLIYWKYLDFEPAHSRRIAEYFSKVSGYAVEETPYASGFAGYKDWFIQNYNRPGYTIEAGIGVNPLPLSQFGEIYKDNLGILVGAITQI